MKCLYNFGLGIKFFFTKLQLYLVAWREVKFTFLFACTFTKDASGAKTSRAMKKSAH